jgi:hypothetical protein
MGWQMPSESQVSPELTELERMVLEAAIRGHSRGAELEAQLNAATVVVRTPSGVGFVTKLQVPQKLSLVEPAEESALPVVLAEHPALRSGAEFILQVKAGRINCIEAYCYEGMWPADETLFRELTKS